MVRAGLSAEQNDSQSEEINVIDESQAENRPLSMQEAEKGLFTWREGAPANRFTRLEGLKHCPPLHAIHLTRAVSGLCELSLKRPLSISNITADRGNFFPSHFCFLQRHGPVL